MSDYRELPERVAAAVAVLKDAEKRAHANAHRCRKCGHVETLRVESAEASLLAAVRKEYGGA